MAKERGHEKSIGELRQEIAHSRDRLAQNLSGLKYEVDFPLKFRKSFQRHAALWISAAVLTGVAVTARAMPSKKRIVYLTRGSGQREKGKEQKKGLLQAGLTMGLLRFGATLLRPVVISFVTRKFGGQAGRGSGSSRW
jgi:hypothetical protein